MERRKKSKKTLHAETRIEPGPSKKGKKKVVRASSGKKATLEAKHFRSQPAATIKKKKKPATAISSAQTAEKKNRRKSKKDSRATLLNSLQKKIRGHQKKISRVVVRNKKKSAHFVRKKPYRSKWARKISKKKKELLIEIGLSLIILSVILMIISGVTFRLVKVEGYAMSPRINDQEVVVVNKLSDFERFDFIYFAAPTTGTEMVRRVIGMPGEEIFYRDEILYVNDREVPERFLDLSTYLAGGQVWTEDFNVSELLGAGLTRIPEGYYFVMGENRPYAADSRLFGLVPEENIVGKVTMRLLPLRSMSRFI